MDIKKSLKVIVRCLMRTGLVMFAILAFGVVSFFAIQIYITQSTKAYILSDAATAQKSDAIMVLGAMVYSDGQPSPVLADRLDYAYELYTLGKAKKIIVSGDHGQIYYDEVNAMKKYLLDKGVPREDIFMDHAGFNTYDSMYRAKEIFCIDRLLICTQDFHINRSVYIARQLGMDAYGYPCEDKEMYNMPWLEMRETLARAKAFADVTVKRSPKFLGDVIPISGDGTVTDD